MDDLVHYSSFDNMFRLREKIFQAKEIIFSSSKKCFDKTRVFLSAKENRSNKRKYSSENK